MGDLPAPRLEAAPSRACCGEGTARAPHQAIPVASIEGADDAALAPGEALIDLADRWRRARRAALRSVLAAHPLPEREAEAEAEAETDDELLVRALSCDEEAAARRVFDNSLQLGKSFSRFFDAELSLEDLPGVLRHMATPCLAGTWTPVASEPALTLERPGCGERSKGRAACDWWREAIDGFVLGVTGGIRHARHESLGHGGVRCLDVVYIDPESPLRFGPISEAMRASLEGVRRMARTFNSTVDVEFLGLSEGVLLYQLKTAGCGSELTLSSLVERAVLRRFPELPCREISSRPVLSGQGDADGP